MKIPSIRENLVGYRPYDLEEASPMTTRSPRPFADDRSTAARLRRRGAISRRLFQLAIVCGLPVLVACPKKKEATWEDAGAPPPPVVDAAPLDLQPITDDGG